MKGGKLRQRLSEDDSRSAMQPQSGEAMRNPTPRRGAGGETYKKASEMRVYGCDHRPTSPTLRHLIGTTLPTPRRGVSHGLAAPRLQDP
ncbi:MAG: hypothetical protein K2M02_09320 [Duncaniella sp.]|nr:hypothetical protein [Duncaniella sp.]